MAQPSSPAALLDSFARPSEARSSEPIQPVGAARSFARPLGAQKVDVPRDEARILRKLKLAALTAGEDWFYHIPVPTKRQPGIAFVEGPSIKMTSDLARLYGNCVVETHLTDLGDVWIVEARFSDLETGYSLSRPHQQGKPAEARERPGGRAQEAVLQATISKAIRNVVATALPSLTEFGLKEARRIVLSALETNLEAERARTIDAMAGVMALQDAEGLLGRTAELWSAADLHQLRSVLRAVKDGMLGLGDLTLPRRTGESPSPDGAQKDVEALAAFARMAPTRAEPPILLSALPQCRAAAPPSAEDPIGEPQPNTSPRQPRWGKRDADQPSRRHERKRRRAALALAEGAAP